MTRVSVKIDSCMAHLQNAIFVHLFIIGKGKTQEGRHLVR
jgi:hypothetical protein